MKMSREIAVRVWFGIGISIMDTSDLGKWNCRVLHLGSTSDKPYNGWEKKNNVIRAWKEAVKAKGKKKVNNTNNWREVQPKAVLLN